VQLINGWKQWINQESFAERRDKAMVSHPPAAPEENPEYDD
jgi:hypothetical protein